ncbi:hypothetical protein, partial [Streptomyces bauhiniae]
MPKAGLEASACDMQAISYLEAAEIFEKRFARYVIRERPDVLDHMRELASAAWQLAAKGERKNSTKYRERFATPVNIIPGSIGGNLSDLENVTRNGNLREVTALIFSGGVNGAFNKTFEIGRLPQLEEQRRRRVKKSERAPSYAEASKVQPPLSAAEKRHATVRDKFNVRRVTWLRGDQYAELRASDPMHQAGEETGALVGPGLSGTTVVMLDVAQGVSTLTGYRADYRMIRLAAAAVLIEVGHHTLHEVMQTAKLWGVERGVSGLDDYRDDLLRYRSIEPLTHNELNRISGGVFPDQAMGSIDIT